MQAGTTIADLNKLLFEYGMAMPNLGDIAYQTISGAISTATHGTGAKLTGIAGQVIGLDIVTGDGSIVSCSATEEKAIFESARVGVGALGALSTVTLQCVPEVQPQGDRRTGPRRQGAGRTSTARRQQRTLRVLLGAAHRVGADQDEQQDRRSPPVASPAFKFFKDKILMENIAFGAVTKARSTRARRPSRACRG